MSSGTHIYNAGGNAWLDTDDAVALIRAAVLFTEGNGDEDDLQAAVAAFQNGGSDYRSIEEHWDTPALCPQCESQMEAADFEALGMCVECWEAEQEDEA